MKSLFASVSLLSLAIAAPARADDVAVTSPGAPVAATQVTQGAEVIVTAPLTRTEADLLQGVSVLTGEELQRELRSTIGETLARLPGVSATSFGPNASRPILRGLQGERIRVLTDGIGSFDVSNTSVDHAVAIDPLLAQRVEVLRGPAALLYGTSAVGGVVNVIDARIPRVLPDGGYSVDVLGTYGSGAEERSVAGSANAAIGGKFVFNVNGSYLKTDDLRTGGFILSPAARAAARSQIGLPQDVEEGEQPIDFAASANLRGRLPNSAAETWTAGAGAAIVTATGSLGVSYTRYDSFYGVPVRYATEVGQEQEAPRLDVQQDRVDVRAEVDGGGFLDKLRFRAGHADYRHFELEPSGEVGTAFFNKATEARLETLQANRGGWQGASGLQYFNRRFDVNGEEAFLPRSETNQFGLFTLQSYDVGSLRVEGGARYEVTDLASRVLIDDLSFPNAERKFRTVSGSLGASFALAPDVRIGINGSRTERAPSAEELFANGPHAGTQAYELGNPNFVSEKAWGIEATFHAHGERFSIDASAYHSWFNDFIFETQVNQGVCEDAAAPSGREVDLPCFQYRQANARYYGFEVDASLNLAQIGAYRINADVVADYVRATVDDQGPLPRIPPLRVLGGLEARGDRLSARVEAEHVFEQDRVAAFETRTDSFTLVNASISFRPFGVDNRTTLLLSANNIFDVEARRHASFLKDFAPLAGRDIRATVRVAL
jgi:iron complex outermembrane receptor protein